MTENAERDEMRRLLAYANLSKVAGALGVGRAAVSNWAAGRHVTPGRLEQVRALLGQQEEAAPSEEGAAAELLRLWSGPEPPPWAARLTDQIIGAVQADRRATGERMVLETVRQIRDAIATGQPIPIPGEAAPAERRPPSPRKAEPKRRGQ